MCRRCRSLLFGLVLAFLAVACGGGGSGGGGTTSTATAPSRAISHQPTGGTQGFFFLPPLAKATTYSGTFDPNAQLAVEVHQVDALGKLLDPDVLVVRYGMVDPADPSAGGIRVDPTTESYLLNWHTNDFTLIDKALYRVFVLRASDDAQYGYADVQIFTSQKEAKSLATEDVFALKDGRTLVVKMRVEQGAEPVPPEPPGPTAVVTNTKDPTGDPATDPNYPGSFRAAVDYANSNPGTRIVFDIPDTDPGYDASNGVWVIEQAGRPGRISLGIITASDTTIDGTTQTANQGNRNPDGPEVVLSGVVASNGPGLWFQNADRGVVRGLVIRGFRSGWGMGYCVVFEGGTGHVVEGCYFNTEATGMAGVPQPGGDPMAGGLVLSGCSGAHIGGTTAAQRNVFSCIGCGGIQVGGAGATGNVIQGNYIGVNRQGGPLLGEQGPPSYSTTGVFVGNGAVDTQIGGTAPGAGNVISGFAYCGIAEEYGTLKRTVIEGNLIGTDATGTVAIGNWCFGVGLYDGSRLGGTAEGAGNVVCATRGWNGYPGHGVGTGTAGEWTQLTVVEGNKIGVDITGRRALGNAGAGIWWGGGSAQGSARIAGNVIGGNGGDGVYGTAYGQVVLRGNWIGTDASETLDLGNGGNGVSHRLSSQLVVGGLGAGEGNAIAYNGLNGVERVIMYAAPALVQGNRIWANGKLGIDYKLEGDPPNGVTVNYPPDPPFGYIAYPFLQTASVSADGTLVVEYAYGQNGVLTDFYVAEPDDTGFGEGKEFLLSVPWPPDPRLQQLPGGAWRLTVPLADLPAQAVQELQRTKTLTATHSFDAWGPYVTSEFSANVTVN